MEEIPWTIRININFLPQGCQHHHNPRYCDISLIRFHHLWYFGALGSRHGSRWHSKGDEEQHCSRLHGISGDNRQNRFHPTIFLDDFLHHAFCARHWQQYWNDFDYNDGNQRSISGHWMLEGCHRHRVSWLRHWCRLHDTRRAISHKFLGLLWRIICGPRARNNRADNCQLDLWSRSTLWRYRVYAESKNGNLLACLLEIHNAHHDDCNFRLFYMDMETDWLPRISLSSQHAWWVRACVCDIFSFKFLFICFPRTVDSFRMVYFDVLLATTATVGFIWDFKAERELVDWESYWSLQAK